MGYRLVAEVLDHAPPDLTPAELVVLLAIAAEARDDGREARPGMDMLARRVRLTPIGVRRALQRLARRGIEIRTNVAHRGQRTVYRLPFFAPQRGASGTTIPADRGNGSTAFEAEREYAGTTIPADRGVPGTTIPADRRYAGTPLSVSTKQQQRSARIVMDATDATEAEALAVAELIAAERKPKSIHAYLIHLVRDEEIGEWLDRVRANGRRVDVVALLEELRRRPACEHGDPGGDQLHPSTGLALCPQCRRLNQRSA